MSPQRCDDCRDAMASPLVDGARLFLFVHGLVLALAAIPLIWAHYNDAERAAYSRMTDTAPLFVWGGLALVGGAVTIAASFSNSTRLRYAGGAISAAWDGTLLAMYWAGSGTISTGTSTYTALAVGCLLMFVDGAGALAGERCREGRDDP